MQDKKKSDFAADVLRRRNGLIDHATSAEDTIVRMIKCISVYTDRDLNTVMKFKKKVLFIIASSLAAFRKHN